MPKFRAFVKRVIPSRSRRFARFIQEFIEPTPSRTQASNAFLEFFNPTTRRTGLAGRINQFLAPVPSRTGFLGKVNEFLTPTVNRSGRILSVINQFVRPIPARIDLPSDPLERKKRRISFTQRLLDTFRQILNPRTEFAEFIGSETVILEPSEEFTKAINDLVDRAKDRFALLVDRLADGRITTDTFRNEVYAEIRRLHVAAMFLGIRGVGNFTGGVLDMVDQRVSEQLNFFDRFFADKIEGSGLGYENRLGGTGDGRGMVQRLTQYASAGRVTAIEAQRTLIEEEWGDEPVNERRVLGECDNCFVRNTLILMPGGRHMPIQHIRIGDVVITRWGFRAVTKIFKRGVREVIYTIKTLDGLEVTCTGNHPFLTIENGWVEARALTFNDTIVLYGHPFYAKPIISCTLNKVTAEVFNLEVNEDHEYVANGFVVHNCSDCITLSSVNWSPIGTLPAIGENTRCGQYCCCTFEYCFARDIGDCPE